MRVPTQRRDGYSPRARDAARIGAVVAVSLFWLGSAGGVLAQTENAPAVQVAPVKSAPLNTTQQYIGTVQAIQTVDLKAQVTGFLQTVSFAEGGLVKKDQTLYQLDPTGYQAQLSSAQASLASAKAGLEGANAELEDAQLEFERKQTLAQKGDVSQANFDQARAKRDKAKAQVDTAKADIQEANAQISSAQYNLSHTTITAPIDGRIV